MKRGRLTNQQVNVYRSYKRQLAHLPPPGPRYTRDDAFGDGPMTRTAFEAALGCSLIHQVSREPDAPAEFTTDRKLFEALREDGYVDADGGVVNPCGTGGPLDCGSRAWLTHADTLECKLCGEHTDKADAKEAAGP